MDRIRQGFGHRAARFLTLMMLLLTVALIGCRKEIPEEKARAIFSEVSVELIKRHDASDAAKSAMVDAILEKNGFVRKDLEYMLKTRPETKAWLEEALKTEIERDLVEQKAQWEKRLVKARTMNEKNAEDLDKDQSSKFERIEQETARKKAELDQEFEARLKKLQAQAEVLQKDLQE